METTAERWSVRRPHSFGALLIAIVLLGVLVRAAYILVVMRGRPLFTDSSWYYTQGQNLRHGVGMIDYWLHYSETSGNATGPPPYPTAEWPPGYPVLLAGVQTLFGDAVRTSQLGGCVTGAATIGLTGLWGRAIAGRAVGLLAALLIALSPAAIAVDGSLLSETLFVPLVLLALLIAQHAQRHPTVLAWCALGAVIGAAALTRTAALLLIPVVMLPTAVLTHDRLRHLLPCLLAGIAALTIVVAPWVVRNANAVGLPTIDTVSSNGAFASANCELAYGGKNLGWWAQRCMEMELTHTMSEAEYARRERSRGLSYAFSHVERWPIVAGARVLRVWGLWNPDEQTRVEASQSREVNWQRMAWIASTGTLALGIGGFVLLARRRRPIALLVASVTLATLSALFAYGNSRFAAPAMPALAIGAAACVLVLWDRYFRIAAEGAPASVSEEHLFAGRVMALTRTERCGGTT